MSTILPKSGFVFWPVGTGDSTTVVLDKDNTILQVDLHHLSKSEEDGDDHEPIIDNLVKLLPKRNGMPFLASFALSHPDKDHILGFEDLNRRVNIGQIWHTPRIFRENNSDLCDDAISFKNEVERRRIVTMAKGESTPSGDRVLIIGHDDIFSEGKYQNFPECWRACPGDIVKEVDGCKFDNFEAFIHAPFKDGNKTERNETSLSLHVTLTNDGGQGRLLLFGDLSYPMLRRIVDKTKEKDRQERLDTDLLLAPHHCSKSAMYVKDENNNEVLRQDILDDFDKMVGDQGCIIASCESDFSDEKGKNPPHLKARHRYEEIVASKNQFICTHEFGGPVSYGINSNGCTLQDSRSLNNTELSHRNGSSLSIAIEKARGPESPPTQEVGFGKYD